MPKGELTKEELIRLFDKWINDAGQWQDFIDDMEDEGYSEEEIQEVLDECEE